RFDHHIHALTPPDHERVTRIESVGIRYRNRVHRDHVETVTLQDHLQVVAVSGIEQPPPLHLAGLHMQGRAGDAVCRIGKSAWLARVFPSASTGTEPSNPYVLQRPWFPGGGMNGLPGM